ncbi:MAG: ribosome silencing factor [Bacteroidetes bacterium]|nr:MAG: ribosome silencing factor [Bacteroidota bacterium]
MVNKKDILDTDRLKETIIYGLQEIKGTDITVLDLTKIKNALADYFIICTGNSDTHIEALMNSVEAEVLKVSGELPWRVEGKSGREWILMDYFSIVVHIFRKDKRRFYSLEDLWGDGVITQIPDLA